MPGLLQLPVVQRQPLSELFKTEGMQEKETLTVNRVHRHTRLLDPTGPFWGLLLLTTISGVDPNARRVPPNARRGREVAHHAVVRHTIEVDDPPFE